MTHEDPRLAQLTQTLKDGLAQMRFTSSEQAYAEAFRALDARREMIQTQQDRPLEELTEEELRKLLLEEIDAGRGDDESADLIRDHMLKLWWAARSGQE